MTGRKRGALLTAVAAVLIMGLFVFWKAQNRVICGVSEGTYAVTETDAVFPPTVTFDLQSRRFAYVGNPLSSYAAAGTMEIENNRISAVTDDGRYTYTFQILDHETIEFVEKGSVQCLWHTVIADGTAFRLIAES